MSLSFTEPKKLTIVTVDGPSIMVTAQYNPKEIGIDKSVPWNKHKNPKGDIPMLEFTNAENRSMSLELFFDKFEAGGTVQPEVELLTQMTRINASAGSETEKHPPRVLVAFGIASWFRGVIESLGVKYTMFDDKGMPVRATCSLKIKEVDAVQAGGGEE